MDNYNKNLILVDINDKIIASEKTIFAHMQQNLKLHRAFSIFLFNTKNKLLLQRRANKKLVYPGLWANTCCSHPWLSQMSFDAPISDCKKWGVERIRQEFGITITEDDLFLVGKVLYKSIGSESYGYKISSENDLATGSKVNADLKNTICLQYNVNAYTCTGYNEALKAKGSLEFRDIKLDERRVYLQDLNGYKFGEYEIDYVFICRKDVDICMNSDEIQDYKYMHIDDVFELNEKLAPWVKIILREIDMHAMLKMLS